MAWFVWKKYLFFSRFCLELCYVSKHSDPLSSSSFIILIYHPHPLLSLSVIILLSLIILKFILIWRIGWNLGGRFYGRIHYQRCTVYVFDSKGEGMVHGIWWFSRKIAMMKVPKLMSGLLRLIGHVSFEPPNLYLPTVYPRILQHVSCHIDSVVFPAGKKTRPFARGEAVNWWVSILNPQKTGKYTSGWWFQIFFIFTPIWGRFPFWLIFFKGVETTN